MVDSFSLLVKPVSADCNLSCRYCFYLRPTDPYRGTGRHVMDDRTLRAMIASHMESAGRCASFGWQGGEPLLAGIDFFQKAVSYQEQYGSSGQLVSNNLQTNGTLLNDDWAKFFRRYNFFIGVSLDGPEAFHDAYRRFAGGNSSFRQALAGIQVLRKHQVDFSILTVVNDVTARKPRELYDFFLRQGIFRLQFIPCVEVDKKRGEKTDYSVGVKDYGEFLCSLFDVWYNKGNPAASIRLFENVLAIFAGLESEICEFHDRCGTYAVVEHNGDVYPCDFFVEEKWLLGNLVEEPLAEIIRSRKAETFNSAKQLSSSPCGRCPWNALCRCGCQHYRTKEGENYFCAAYNEFFSYTYKRFNRLREHLTQTT